MLAAVGRALASAALFVAAIAAGVLVLEGVVRLTLPAFDPSGRFSFGYEVGTLVLGTPGSVSRQAKNTGDYDVEVRINRHGLRDDKDVSKATPGDVIVVGDSFAWGWGVEARDRFSDVLQAKTGLLAYNVSTPTNLDGYRDLLAYVETLGGKIGRVVLALCMENDLGVYAEAADPSDSTGPTVHFSGVKSWLEHHSAAYLFITSTIHQTPWLTGLATRIGLIIPNLEGISRNIDSTEIVASTAARVAAIADRYPTLVVLIPSRALWVGRDRSTEDRVHSALVAGLRAKGVALLDLKPLQEAGGKPLDYHFANDGHWNARGHRLAADAIADRLQRR